MKKVFFIFLFFTHILYAHSITTNSSQNIYDYFQVQYLNDKNSTLTIEDIATEKFTQTTRNRFALGYKKGAVWFKFSITNNTQNQHFILSLNEHFYEKANLYYYDKNWIKK